MTDPNLKVSEESTVSVPIKNLISILGAVAISTWAYFDVTQRLNFLEFKSGQMLEEIEENDSWIDNFEPPQAVQETITRVRELELQVRALQERVKALHDK